jgi:DNA-binding NarL/FixJ family response regulator
VRDHRRPHGIAEFAGAGVAVSIQSRLPLAEASRPDPQARRGPGAPPLVAIVEDHALVADSIALGLSVVGIVARRIDPDDGDVVGQVRALAPDLVLLDLAVDDDPDAGLRIIGPLGATGFAVVVVTGSVDHLRHAECLEAGALGVVQKCQPMASLVEAVQRALRGEPLLAQVERLTLLLELDHARRREGRWRTGIGELTPREQQVLAALIDGVAAGRIAHSAGVSVATVRSHIRSILSKLGVHSQLEAVATATRLGWRPDEGADGRAMAGAAPTAGW